MANPYESASEATKKLLALRASWWFGVFAWFYPALLVAAFYGTWLIAWSVLRHVPRPSLDDPKYISIAVDIPYVIAGLLLVGFPAAAIAGVVMQLSNSQRSCARRFLWCVILVLIWVATIAFLRWDPMLVAEWYMD